MRTNFEKAKEVAERNKDKSKHDFFVYLMDCGWEYEQVSIMWMMAQRMKEGEK